MKTNNGKSGKSDIRLMLVIAGLYTLTQLMTFLRIYSIRKMDKVPIDLPELLRDRLVAWPIGMLFVILIVKTTKRFLLQKISWPRIISIHLLFALLISFIWYISFIYVHKLIVPDASDSFRYFDRMYWFLINLDKLFLLYLITVSITYTYFYVQRDNENKIRQSQIEAQLLQTRLKMLQSQLHPHFLFNTLNSIVSLVDINVKKAKAMIADLGDLLRHVLDHRDEQIVSLNEEMNILRKYVEIEKTRFSDDLEVNWQLEGDLREAEIPNMLLQPLVENAIRHGFSRQHPRLHLLLHLERQADRLLIRVEDDGQGFDKTSENALFEKGTGLRITRERLQSIYGENFTFTVDNKHPGVRNFINIPLRAPGSLSGSANDREKTARPLETVLGA